MKKIFLMLALLLPFIAFADNVSSEQARKVAETFFSTTVTRASGPSLTLKWTGNVPTRAAQEPAFYVFDNSSGGFVIVAGDDKVEPILGYSHDGEFHVEGMPANVQYWFDFLQNGIAYLRTAKFTPSAEVQAKWSALRSGITTRGGTGVGGGKQLETAQWNQYEPYNLKASEWCDFGQSVYTGCVATATAIIMRYHRYPEKGTGTLENYSYESDSGYGRTVRGFELGHTYKWDDMPLTYSSSSTVAQNEAVAQLMLDCGVMVGMKYGTTDESGSGANTWRVPSELVEHMGYDPGYESLDREYVSTYNWINKIIESIDHNCPVLMSASNGRGGHAFILDGYDNNRNIRINWGWGGSNNGYYASPDFGGYNYGQAIFTNIKPYEGGSYNEEAVIGLSYYNNVNGLSFTSGPNISSSGEVSMNFATGLIYNMGADVATVNIIFAHADKNDNIKYKIRESSLTLSPGYGTLWSSIYYSVAQKDIAYGDKIKIFYQYGDGEINPVLYSEDTVGELLLPYGDDASFDIEEDTSAEYFPNEKTLVITSHPKLEFQLTNSSGASIDNGAELVSGVLTIDLKTLANGKYTLVLTVGDKSKELIFTVGE